MVWDFCSGPHLLRAADHWSTWWITVVEWLNVAALIPVGIYAERVFRRYIRALKLGLPQPHRGPYRRARAMSMVLVVFWSVLILTRVASILQPSSHPLEPVETFDRPVPCVTLSELGDAPANRTPEALRIQNFTARESCGKCVPCRIGTTRMMEILNRICDGQGQEGDIELLEELCVSIKDGSLCGLGQTAPNPVLTTIRYFREEYEAHIRDKKCPACECSALLTISIDPDKCTGCTVCARKCPVECISGERKEPHVINQSACIKCKQCVSSCKFGAIVVE